MKGTIYRDKSEQIGEKKLNGCRSNSRGEKSKWEVSLEENIFRAVDFVLFFAKRRRNVNHFYSNVFSSAFTLKMRL